MIQGIARPRGGQPGDPGTGCRIASVVIGAAGRNPLDGLTPQGAGLSLDGVPGPAGGVAWPRPARSWAFERRRPGCENRDGGRASAMESESYDLVVIGSGPAGEKGAAQAA